MTVHIHDHDHPQPVELPDAGVSTTEAIQSGTQAWLAREFVGGLIAMAQSNDIDPGDFLADKCMILAMRAAAGEAEVEVLRGQLDAVLAQNGEYQRKLEDCHCHDEDSAVVVPVGAPPPPMVPNLLNGGPDT